MNERALLPPADLLRRVLPTVRIPAGASWFRLHRAGTRPLWFGPGPKEPPRYRFDDPEGKYRVCYVGQTLEAAFAEVFLRDIPVTLLAQSDLRERMASRVTTLRAVDLVQFHGAGLAKLGATAEVVHGPHQVSRPWGRACWAHPSQPDGLVYRPKHDDDQLAVALFDRARDSVEAPEPPIRVSVLPELSSLLRRYGIGLAD